MKLLILDSRAGTVNSYLQWRVNFLALIMEPGSRAAVGSLSPIKPYVASTLKPGNEVNASAEPSTVRSECLNEPQIKIPPKTFWGMTSVVPQSGDYPSQPSRIVNNDLAAFPSMGRR